MSSALADKWTILDRFIQLWRYRKVVGSIPLNCVLADLGCGRGDFLRHVQSRIATGYGIDTAIAHTDVGGNLHFKEANLNNAIPLNDEIIDVVISLAVIEHLHAPAVFVKEIFRILKPDGMCILTTPSPLSKPLLEFLAYRLKIISARDIKDHKRYFCREDLRELFSDFGTLQISSFQGGLNMLVVAKKR